MKRLFGILAIALGCYYGVAYYQAVNNSEPEVDPSLQEIVVQWKNAMRSEGIDYHAGFNRIDHIQVVSEYGVDAGQYDKGSRTISISKEVMVKGFYSTRVALYHELGHYVFNLEHTDDHTRVMFHKTIDETIYKILWNEMKEQYLINCREHEWESRI